MAYCLKNMGHSVDRFLNFYDDQRLCGLGDVELDSFFSSGSFPIEYLDFFLKIISLIVNEKLKTHGKTKTKPTETNTTETFSLI